MNINYPFNSCHNKDFAIYRHMAVLKLTGTWTKQGNEYKSDSHLFSLVIGNRKNQTENKPPQYLLIKHSANKFNYLSGLYPLKGMQAFYIDYENKEYRLSFNTSTTFTISE